MSIASKIPRPLKQIIKDTPVESVFWWWRIQQSTGEWATIPIPNGSVKVLIPREVAEWFIGKYSDQEYEPVFFETVLRTLDPDDVYYDVGSRWGICIKTINGYGLPERNIHGFEADPLNYHYLKQNVVEMDTTITKSFVSDHDNQKSITLDSYSEPHDNPSIVKIDVEGAEMQVLRGMRYLLSSVRPELFIEVHPGHLTEFGDTQNDILDLLESAEYELRISDHRSDLDRWESINRTNLPQEGDYMIRAEPY